MVYLTKVPMSAPVMAFLRLPGLKRLKTRMGILLSIQSDRAEVSIILTSSSLMALMKLMVL